MLLMTILTMTTWFNSTQIPLPTANMKEMRKIPHASPSKIINPIALHQMFSHLMLTALIEKFSPKFQAPTNQSQKMAKKLKLQTWFTANTPETSKLKHALPTLMFQTAPLSTSYQLTRHAPTVQWNKTSESK